MGSRSLIIRAAVVCGMGAYLLLTTPQAAEARRGIECIACVNECPADPQAYCLMAAPHCHSGTYVCGQIWVDWCGEVQGQAYGVHCGDDET